MRHSKYILIIAAFAFNTKAFAQMQTCYESSKELYKEIQIYNETAKPDASKAVIGSRLEFDLSLFSQTSKLSLQERVKSLETAFAQCDINLSEEEVAELKESIADAKRQQQ